MHPDCCFSPRHHETRTITFEKSSEPVGFQIQGGPAGGIFVSAVNDNSLASQAGLVIGDQLLEVSVKHHYHIYHHQHHHHHHRHSCMVSGKASQIPKGKFLNAIRTVKETICQQQQKCGQDNYHLCCHHHNCHQRQWVLRTVLHTQNATEKLIRINKM